MPVTPHRERREGHGKVTANLVQDCTDCVQFCLDRRETAQLRRRLSDKQFEISDVHPDPQNRETFMRIPAQLDLFSLSGVVLTGFRESPCCIWQFPDYL